MYNIKNINMTYWEVYKGVIIKITRVCIISIILLFLWVNSLSFAYTLIATETHSAKYEGGIFTTGPGKYTYRFEIDESSGIVYLTKKTDVKNNTSVESKVEYLIVSVADGTSPGSSLTSKKRRNQKTITIFGKPGKVETETIMLGEDFFEYCKATSGRFYLATGTVNKLISSNFSQGQDVLTGGQKTKSTVMEWQKKLYRDWKSLPEPPITPYDGPFGGEARAFVGGINGYKGNDPKIKKNVKRFWDFSYTAVKGPYDPELDWRPINHEYEEAIIEDWRRMGYNCAYKGNFNTFRVGKYLKDKYGMLGAIEQTLWGQGPGEEPPFDYTGKKIGRGVREGCNSFFVEKYYDQGVAAVSGQVINYPGALFQVGDHRLTCSWDEVGMRTRSYIDYHPQAAVEFRKYLKEVWFGDSAPNKDTNSDGRTYNQFTGENLTNWDQVQLLQLSPHFKDAWGGRENPEIDKVMWEQPGRFKLLLDFQGYWTIEYFRRVNNDATKAINAKGINGRVSCYPFMQHFIIWPSANAVAGNSFYWYCRLSPVVNVEHMWPDAPAMNLNYAVTDRLAPRFNTPVMGWIWFYFGGEGSDMYNGPNDCARAMARMMGHNVDGTHHWLYSPIYRGRDRRQRLQIAYWQNFFAMHYNGYLASSTPPEAQIAMLMPNYTGYFYRYFQHQKADWAYTAEGLQNSQLNFEMVTEEELELDEGVLDQYKVLYVIASEWTTPTIKKKINAFIKKGGIVFANVDSLSLDIVRNKRTDYLEKTFGVKITHKYKNGFFPSAQTMEESAWAKTLDTWDFPAKLQGHSVQWYKQDDPRSFAKIWARTHLSVVKEPDGKVKRDVLNRMTRKPEWKIIRGKDGHPMRDKKEFEKYDAVMDKMPKKVRGITQSPLDMRKKHMITFKGSSAVPTYGEIDTARAVNKGKPIAWYGKEIIGVETRNTVWLGLRLGNDLHAISPRMSMHRTTGPVNPFMTDPPNLYQAHKPYADMLAYAAEKAGVERVVQLTNGRRKVYNLEILPRANSDGTLMVIVINHDETETRYNVKVDSRYVKKGMEAWSMLDEKTIEKRTDGKFKLNVPSWGVSVFMLGTPKTWTKSNRHKPDLTRRT